LKGLLDHDAVTQQDYDEASTNLRVLQAQIKEVLVSIDKTRIRAPFDGQIGMINIHPGAIVSTNTILANIEDNRFIKTEFSVPEKYASLISTGSLYSFTTTATDKTYKAHVSALSAKLSENTRSLVVRGITPNPTGELIPGQSARVTLAFTSPTKTVTVSANALIPSPAGYTLFVSRNGEAHLTPVEIGERNSGTVQILSGVADGDTVVTSNILRLGQGTPISFASIK
jgi:membrane fusion protein (multidrug efflux system)